MEYTKDVIFNVQYGGKVETIKLRNRKWTRKLLKIYNENRFIVITLSITTLLIGIDIFMVYHFINLLATL